MRVRGEGFMGTHPQSQSVNAQVEGQGERERSKGVANQLSGEFELNSTPVDKEKILISFLCREYLISWTLLTL